MKGVIGIAPVVQLKYSTESFLKTIANNPMISWLLERYGYLEIMSETKGSSSQGLLNTLSYLCYMIPEICTITIGIFADTNSKLINQGQLDVFIQRLQQGTSLRNLDHMGQIMKSKRF